MRANVKPLVHWAIYKQYTLRYHERTPTRVTGQLTGSQGVMPFVYDPNTRRITLPTGCVQINEHGWEVESSASS